MGWGRKGLRLGGGREKKVLVYGGLGREPFRSLVVVVLLEGVVKEGERGKAGDDAGRGRARTAQEGRRGSVLYMTTQQTKGAVENYAELVASLTTAFATTRRATALSSRDASHFANPHRNATRPGLD